MAPPPDKRIKEPYAAVPKHLLDDLLLGHFTGNELKVVLAVARYTFGHYDQRDGARISREFLSKKTGIHDRTLRAIVKKLVAEGVLLEEEPAHARSPAKLALQRDPDKWGIYSPAAPPRRAQRGNPDKLREHQFSSGQSGRARPDKTESPCGHGAAPSAGVDARTSHGHERPHSEDLEEGLLKKADSGDLEEPPLSAEGPEERISDEEGKARMDEFLAQHPRERMRAVARKAGVE